MANSQHDVNIPIDDWDSDSAYDDGGDLESATETLRSAIWEYHYENGRRYHAYRAGEYWGPNDEQQADQLDISHVFTLLHIKPLLISDSHHIFNIMMGGKLYMAPITKNPKRCLDVGTGTGIWAIDFADLFPNCQVIGTDLSPIQPREVPPNLQFEVDDACAEWVYTKDSFDFIHVRGFYGSVANWPKFYQEIMKHLKPGAYVEQAETSIIIKSDDGTVTTDHIFTKWGKVAMEAAERFGKSMNTVDESKQGLIDAGFEDVVEHRFKWPIGGWSKDPRLKDIGLYNRLNWVQGVEGWCMYLLTKYLGWQHEEVMVYVAQMRQALRDRSIHAYHDVSVVWGRKPDRATGFSFG